MPAEKPRNDSAVGNSAEILKQQTLEEANRKIIAILKSGNFEELSAHIHPEKGIRFSMYAFSDTLKNKHFSREEFEKYLPTKILFTWGEKDGSGELLVLSIEDYLKNWLYKRDFSGGKYAENTFIGHGNSLNNLKQIYPKAEFTENYIAGTEKYGGMDWNSLLLVFEKKDGKYFLVAIINDQWTT